MKSRLLESKRLSSLRSYGLWRSRRLLLEQYATMSAAVLATLALLVLRLGFCLSELLLFSSIVTPIVLVVLGITWVSRH